MMKFLTHVGFIKNCLLFQVLAILILSNIQSSFASNSVDQAFQYGIGIIKSRIDYFNSLKEFINNPENEVEEKLDLLETLSSEKHSKYFKIFENRIPFMNDRMKIELFEPFATGFDRFLDQSLILNYEFLLNNMQLRLESVADFPESIELRNDLTRELKKVEKLFPSLKWDEVDRRANLMAIYRPLKACIFRFEHEKLRKDLSRIADDILTFDFEFHSLELPILEDLEKLFIGLMPSEDREFVGLFKRLEAKDFPNTFARTFVIKIDDSEAMTNFQERNHSSFLNLLSAFKILNHEYFRIQQKLQYKLKSKSFSGKLKKAPEISDLAQPPNQILIQVQYFLESIPNFINVLRIVESQVYLDEISKKLLSDIFQSISEIQPLTDHLVTLNFTEISNTAQRVVDWAAKNYQTREHFTSLRDFIQRSWKIGFLQSYATNAVSVILSENLKFNTELVEKINNLVQLLQSFDQNGVKGRKQPFKVKRKDSQVAKASEERSSQSTKELGSEALSPLLSQASVSEEGSIGVVPTYERKEEQHAEPKKVALRQTEEKQQKIEIPVSSCPFTSDYLNQEAIEVYSQFSEEAEQPKYLQLVQDNLKIKTKDYKLLDKLFHPNPGGISSEDLNRLILHCGGLVEQTRGSHIKITMPGKKVFSAYRPHGRGRSEKVRNFLLDIYRKALIDVKNKILVD